MEVTAENTQVASGRKSAGHYPHEAPIKCQLYRFVLVADQLVGTESQNNKLLLPCRGIAPEN